MNIQNGKAATNLQPAVVNGLKQGTGVVSRGADLLGRVGTLLTMAVSTVTTTTDMVTGFVEGVYWKGAVYAGILVFLNLPVLSLTIWLIAKAWVQSIYKKIRPQAGKTSTVSNAENKTVTSPESVDGQPSMTESRNAKSSGQYVTTNQMAPSYDMVQESLSYELLVERIEERQEVAETNVYQKSLANKIMEVRKTADQSAYQKPYAYKTADPSVYQKAVADKITDGKK